MAIYIKPANLSKGITINGKFTTDIDVTNQFLKTEDDYANLFDWLNQKKEIRQDTFLKNQHLD